MSGADARSQIARRLEWLRLLGVETLSPGAPGSSQGGSTPLTPSRGAAAAPAETVPPADNTQDGLFGDPAPRPAARRRADADERPRLETTAAPMATDPAAALEMIRVDLGDCRRCRLCEARTRIVFGVGNPRARLMFIGEGPGADEDAQGEPFVGRAGQLLTRIIESMGMTRGDVYIANVVKCRPPENRTPRPDEVEICSPFLFRQIQAIHPAVIVCLGTPATQTILGTSATITRVRGQFREAAGMRVMPTYHPAYLLRNPAAKREVWEDMKQVMAFLREDAGGR